MTDNRERTRLLQRFLRETAKPDGGHSTYGRASVEQAVADGAVERILLVEDTAFSVDGVPVTLYLRGSRQGQILASAFGGVAAILKGGKA